MPDSPTGSAGWRPDMRRSLAACSILPIRAFVLKKTEFQRVTGNATVQRPHDLLRQEPVARARRAVRPAAHSERERALRAQRGHGARRRVGRQLDALDRTHREGARHQGTPDRRRRMAQRARCADGADLRPLRCAARRAARAVEQPAVRADGARRQDLRARFGRRQRATVPAREGARGASRDARHAAGQRHRTRRGRRRSRQRDTSPSSSKRTPRSSRATRWSFPIRRCSRPACRRFSRRCAASPISRSTSAAPERSPLGQLRRRGDEPGDGAGSHPRHDARRRRAYHDPRVLRRRARLGRRRAPQIETAAIRRRGIPRRDRVARAVRRERVHDARASVDASDVRSERLAQRLHRRRRQDGASLRWRWPR